MIATGANVEAKVKSLALEDGLHVDLSRPDNSDFNKGRSAAWIALWYFVGAPLLSTRWIPLRPFKAGVLRAFGAQVGAGSYIKPGVRVKFPWYLTIGDHCWIGEDVWIDNLAPVKIGSHVCVSQGAYLCTGNHDWTTSNMKLFRREITIEDGCWIGARVLVSPGVAIRTGAIVSAGSVVTGNVPEWQIWGGNPAKHIRDRHLRSTPNRDVQR